MSKILKIGNRVLKIGGRVLRPCTPPTPTYDEVTIGSQTWMSKNLAIDDGQEGIYTQTVNYGKGDVVEYYYTWYAALRVADTVQGWHVPTKSEWDALATAVGGSGKKLKSTYGWESGNGDGSYGFAAFPAGRWYSGSFEFLGEYSFFWTVTSHSSKEAYNRSFSTGTLIDSSYHNKKAYAYSVRLVKDS